MDTLPLLPRPLHLGLSILALGPLAAAGNQEAGSLLVFPEFDNRSGNVTYVTITNTNADAQAGTVDVHIVYVDASTCIQSNRQVRLTPRDTTTFLTSFHVPAVQRGYLFAYAQSPTTGKAIDFDFLIGTSLRIQASPRGDYSISPFVFEGLTGPDQVTDVNSSGKPDLDGIEYDRAPNRIFVPRFFNQHAEPLALGTWASELVLFQPLSTAGTTTQTAFLVYNDNEQPFSIEFSFQCWQRARLVSISGVFTDDFLKSTAHDPSEVGGLTWVETGWFEVKGTSSTSSTGQSTSNPPVLGVLIDVKPNSAAQLPFLERP